MADIFDDDFMGGGGLNNGLTMNPRCPFWQHQHRFVRRIMLRGTGWDGSHHQELMIELQGQLLLRISRNNGMDTFQIGANPSKYNTLVERHVSGDTITCRRVLQAFGEVRRLCPTYDRANCRRFAQDIFEALDPDVVGAFQEESGGRGSSAQEIKDLFF
ncbi:hypothetical protein IHE49_03640 [Rhodanobacter sp. 7MK24]|uniref:hypothetical protein n=1 Tax=Rhodanobacter sp. 7MK24 TaxID=2775922 RepID=UPI001780BC54|nr:hypothetical protein [Rhodanobacter sp. 7MK24]MBD8879570.1 hypothetical protein [Rhodanobacter sp. 7MK24]